MDKTPQDRQASASSSTPPSSHVTLADVLFRPYALGSASSLSSTDPHSMNAAPHLSCTVTELFRNWAAANNFCTEELSGLSEACTYVFRAVDHCRAHPSPLSLLLHKENASTARLEVTISTSALRAFPSVLYRISNPLRACLWHFFRTADHPSNSESSESDRDKCGFIDCAGACTARVRKEDVLDFLFNRTLKRCTEGRAAQRAPPPQMRSPHSLLALPQELIERIAQPLAPTDVSNLSQSCAEIETSLQEFVPGLCLLDSSLYIKLSSKQIFYLKQMMDKENKREDIPMPLLRKIPLSVRGFQDICAVVDMVNGTLMVLASMPSLRNPAGGLFCQEPGGSRTLIFLSLILKTVGTLPKVPHGFSLGEVGQSGPIKKYKESRLGQFSRESPPQEWRIFAGSLREGTQLGFKPCWRFPPQIRDISDSSTDIFLSGATVVITPTANQWISVISLLSRRDGLRLLHIQSAYQIPSRAEDLATMYDIVIVNHLVIEQAFHFWDGNVSTLYRVHFQRLIVEGERHIYSGRHATRFNACSSLRADKRWVLITAPLLPVSDADLLDLGRILCFIQDEAYGLDKDAWLHGISFPYSKGEAEGMERLAGVLRRVMIGTEESFAQITQRAQEQNSG